MAVTFKIGDQVYIKQYKNKYVGRITRMLGTDGCYADFKNTSSGSVSTDCYFSFHDLGLIHMSKEESILAKIAFLKTKFDTRKDTQCASVSTPSAFF